MARKAQSSFWSNAFVLTVIAPLLVGAVTIGVALYKGAAEREALLHSDKKDARVEQKAVFGKVQAACGNVIRAMGVQATVKNRREWEDANRDLQGKMNELLAARYEVAAAFPEAKPPTLADASWPIPELPVDPEEPFDESVRKSLESGVARNQRFAETLCATELSKLTETLKGQ